MDIYYSFPPTPWQAQAFHRWGVQPLPMIDALEVWGATWEYEPGRASRCLEDYVERAQGRRQRRLGILTVLAKFGFGLDYSGPICLDVERHAPLVAQHRTHSGQWGGEWTGDLADLKAGHIQCLADWRALMPNALIGFYNITGCRWSNDPDDPNGPVPELDEIGKECDLLFPVMYRRPAAHHDEELGMRLQRCLDIAQPTQLVIPLIWHRWRDKTAMTPEEVGDLVEMAEGGDGVSLWSAPDDHLRVDMLDTERRTQSAILEYRAVQKMTEMA